MEGRKLYITYFIFFLVRVKVIIRRVNDLVSQSIKTCLIKFQFILIFSYQLLIATSLVLNGIIILQVRYLSSKTDDIIDLSYTDISQEHTPFKREITDFEKNVREEDQDSTLINSVCSLQISKNLIKIIYHYTNYILLLNNIGFRQLL